MKTKALAGAVGVLIVAFVLSLFSGSVNAAMQKQVIVSDTFTDEDVDYDIWDTADEDYEDLYAVNEDEQLEISGYDDVPAFIEKSIFTAEGITEDTFVAQFTMSKYGNDVVSNDTRNHTYIYASIMDIDSIDDNDNYNGVYIGLVISYDARYDYSMMEILYKDSEYDDSETLTVDAMYISTVDIDYTVTMGLNKTANTAFVSVEDTETDNVYSQEIGDLYDIDSDMEFAVGFSGSIGFASIGSDDVPGEDVTAVGYVDDFELYTMTYVAPTPTPTPTPTEHNYAQEIGLFLILVGIVIVAAAAIYREELGQYFPYVVAVGLILIALGAINYYYQYVKTIPYILP